MNIPDAGVGRPTAIRWRVLGWIVLASIIACFLRFNLSVAAPAMMHDLGLSETQLGLVLGAFAWSYGLFQAPGGMLGERIGPRRADDRTGMTISRRAPNEQSGVSQGRNTHHLCLDPFS